MRGYVSLWPGAESREFKVQRGVRQGDPLSPVLFNLVLDEVLKEVGLLHEKTRIRDKCQAKCKRRPRHTYSVRRRPDIGLQKLVVHASHVVICEGGAGEKGPFRAPVQVPGADQLVFVQATRGCTD